MKIDLNKILARDNYKRMTKNLKQVTEEVAKRIRIKIDELDIENNSDFDKGEIGTEDVVVRIITVKSNSGYETSFLGIKRHEEENDHSYYASLEDINDSYYFCGDFTAKIYGATSKEALSFLNASAKLIQGLGEIEQRQTEEIQKIIDNISNVNNQD